MNGKRPDNSATPAVDPLPLSPVNDTMRRLQIGIAGVLTVLLLVGMAGLISDRARERGAQDAAETATIKLPSDTAGSAPLEELGVQPVSKDAKDQNRQADAKVPQSSPSTVPDLEPDPTLERARQSTR